MFSPPMTACLFLWSMFLPSALLALLFSSSWKTLLLTWHLFSIPPTHFSMSILLDPTSLIFSSILFLISANVLQFSSTYMDSDPFLLRFTSLVMMFVLSMLMLIFIPHLMFLLLGWDGLGITSFLLVAYYQNPKSLAAAMVTALMNRVGDTLLLVSIALMMHQGHWMLNTLFTDSKTSFILYLTALAAITKSAQMPFSSWLPAAMAAPTPVSALVHSSTLVTAGVYLLIRFSPMFKHTSFLSPLLLLTASLTMLMAGLVAMTECDLKKIIALSTLSQLGLMVSTTMLGLPTLATFHLFTHALFKALLFLCAGTIIYYFAHTQDLRKVGNTTLQIPTVTTSMLISNLALCGTPFLAGFYSKDLILESILLNPTNLIIILIFFSATILTAAYSTRFTLLLSWTQTSSTPLNSTHDENPNILFPIMILSLCAISAGAALNWMIIPLNTHPTLPLSLKLLPLFSALLGAFFTWNILSSSPILSPSYQPLHPHLTSMWFLTPLTSQNLFPSTLKTAFLASSTLEHAWVETLTSKGLPRITSAISSKSQYLQSSPINSHLLLSLIMVSPLLLL